MTLCSQLQEEALRRQREQEIALRRQREEEERQQQEEALRRLEERRREEEERRQREELLRKQVKNGTRDLVYLIMEPVRMNKLWNLHLYLRHHEFWWRKAKLVCSIEWTVYLYPDFRVDNRNLICCLANWLVLNECLPSCLSLKNGFAAWYFYSFLQKKGRVQYHNNDLFWAFAIESYYRMILLQHQLRWLVLPVFLYYAKTIPTIKVSVFLSFSCLTVKNYVFLWGQL